MLHTSNILYDIIGATTKAATPIYGTAVAVPIALATAPTTAQITTKPTTAPSQPLPL